MLNLFITHTYILQLLNYSLKHLCHWQKIELMFVILRIELAGLVHI